MCLIGFFLDEVDTSVCQIDFALDEVDTLSSMKDVAASHARHGGAHAKHGDEVTRCVAKYSDAMLPLFLIR